MIPLTQEGLNSSVQEISGSPFATVKLFREHLMEGAAETMAQRLAGVSLVHVGCAAFCFYNPTQSLTPRRCSEHDCGVSEHIHPGVSPMSRLSSPEALRSWAEESLSPAPRATAASTSQACLSCVAGVGPWLLPRPLQLGLRALTSQGTPQHLTTWCEGQPRSAPAGDLLPLF